MDAPDKNELERGITAVEIENAIKKMKSGKAPGPDRYPIEFNKSSAPKLILVLVKLFIEVLDKKGSSSNNSTGLYFIVTQKKK